jgi:5-methyltetrahydrofolate--homocysteine methyltransferase
MIMELLEKISQALQKGLAKEVEVLVKEAIESGVTAQEILDNGLLKGMGELGVRFKNGQAYAPEVMVAARALNKGTEILKAKLVEEGVKPLGRIVIATVKGDLHDIGKNLVKMMLEGAGFEVIDLGVNIDEDKIVAAVNEHNPLILCLSALLTTTQKEQKTVIDALEAAGIRNNVKVLIGGAPVTQSFCNQIGADAYAPDAASAADAAKAFVA